MKNRKDREDWILQLDTYMKHTLHYSSEQIQQTRYGVQRMEPKVQTWLKRWLKTGEYPSEAVENVTVQELVDQTELGLNPISAFLTIDYLVKDPAAAKYALTHLPGPMDIDEAAAEQLYQMVQQSIARKEDLHANIQKPAPPQKN